MARFGIASSQKKLVKVELYNSYKTALVNLRAFELEGVEAGREIMSRGAWLNSVRNQAFELELKLSSSPVGLRPPSPVLPSLSRCAQVVASKTWSPFLQGNPRPHPTLQVNHTDFIANRTHADASTLNYEYSGRYLHQGNLPVLPPSRSH